MKDLKKFHKIFDRDNFKEYPEGKIEYRKCDLDSSLAEARRIIQANNLKLEVVTDGSLASYGAFEVRRISA